MINELVGKIISSIIGAEQGSDRILISLSTGEEYEMCHDQNCCETVSIEDINGDIDNLLNSLVTMAEEVSSEENPPGTYKGFQDSFTWTFYKFATAKGYVTIRWYGESNGYYSESVSFRRIK